MAARTRTKAPARKSARGAHPAAHPREVPILNPEIDEDQDPDQPFEEGVRDSIDPDLRQRMVSETAFRLYQERGCVDGYELDDWLQAEADVDHLLLNRKNLGVHGN
jgi:hypothetical protein